MYQLKVYYSNKTSEVLCVSPNEDDCIKYWEENKNDYINHPLFRCEMINQVFYNYFVCCDGFNTLLFKVVGTGLNTSHFVQQMINVDGSWIVKPNAIVHQLVYSPLKGNIVKVTDDEIWEVMGCVTNEQKRKRLKDFNATRNYFDKPNDTEFSVWHESKDSGIGSPKTWTAYEDFPTI